jgi:hypothetical protein
MRMCIESYPHIPVRCLFLVALAVGWADFAQAQTLLCTDFETNPVTQGWTTNGAGSACWTTNAAFSGTHSISASNTGTWLSPMLSTTPLQWYRLSFKSLAPGAVSNPGSIGYAYWAAQFFDTNNNLLTEDQYSAIFQSSNWATNEFRIRAKSMAGPNATLLPVRMQIRFQSISPQVFIDDVLLETTTPQEVAQWGDMYYDTLPAKLAYVPKPDHGSNLPRTLSLLRTGQNLRIVMLGDSVQQDTANAPFDAWLQRLYPGATIQVISSTRGGTGLNYFVNDMSDWVLTYRPDLLCIGGIDNPDDMSVYQSVVDQVRADNLTYGYTTEFLMLTEQWSPNVQAQQFCFLSPGVTELDQEPTKNPGGVPAGFRGDLLTFCAANNIEYLDLTGVACQFIYGAGAAAGVGPPSDTNGDPYSFWMRDYTHSSDHGKMIQGRMLEAFFAPAPTLTIGQSGGGLSLAWPLAATGYYLETAPSLAASVGWTSNNTVYTVTNGQNVVHTNIGSGAQPLYFRLSKP